MPRTLALLCHYDSDSQLFRQDARLKRCAAARYRRSLLMSRLFASRARADAIFTGLPAYHERELPRHAHAVPGNQSELIVIAQMRA